MIRQFDFYIFVYNSENFKEQHMISKTRSTNMLTWAKLFKTLHYDFHCLFNPISISYGYK